MILKTTKTIIGSVIPKSTSGSMLFIDSNLKLAQDNANLFWDAVNKRLGIGTATPTERLSIAGNATLSGYSNIKTSTVNVQISPTMTSKASPKPFTASASAEANALNQAYMAFDGTAEKWTSGTGLPQWVQMDFTAGQVITSYAITNRAASTKNPESWTFQGSNDNSTFTTLDTQTSVPAWSTTVDETRTYTFSNTTAYRYYRLNVTAAFGSTSVEIMELKMYGAGSPKYISDNIGNLYTENSIATKGTVIGDSLVGRIGTIESASYVTNQFFLNNGQLTAAPAIPGSFKPTFLVQTSQVTGSRPLFFGYHDGAGAWNGWVTIGASGAFNKMAFIMGVGTGYSTALQNLGTLLRIGGGDDGNFTDVVLKNSGNVGIGNFDAPGVKFHVYEATLDLVQTKTENTRATGRVIQNTTTNGGIISIRAHGTNYASELFFGIQAKTNAVILGSGGHILYGTFVAKDIIFGTNNVERFRVLSTGEMGIGTGTPTAILHLKAGTATAGTAPLKLTSGTLNTTAEAGAIEFLTDDFYATITTGPARKIIAFIPVQTDITASRALNTTYTAPATRGVEVRATVRCVTTLAAGKAYVQGKSDGSDPPTTVATGIVGIESGLSNEDVSVQISFMVAAGQKYRIDSTTADGTATLGKWFETAY